MGYIDDYIGFEEELREIAGDDFKELETLIEKQDRMVDRCPAKWVEVWNDHYCRGYYEVGDFISSQIDLLKFIPVRMFG